MARDRAKTLGLAKPGEFVLLVCGFHADPMKIAPLVTLLRVSRRRTYSALFLEIIALNSSAELLRGVRC